MNGMQILKQLSWGCLVSLLLCLSPTAAFAHAVLVQADPPLDSHLQKAPNQIHFIFNERLERELYYIRVFNQSGAQIKTDNTKMSEDQKGISLDLPHLKDGIYTITYHIISADGHPVEQSSVLTIGENQSGDSELLVPSAEGHQHGGISFYVDRFLYYLSLLLLTGWTVWGVLYPFSSITNEYNYFLTRLKHFYLFMLVGTAFIEFSSILNGWGWHELSNLLFKSTVGITWMISFVLSILGYALLRRNKVVDIFWVLALLSLEGVNGHAITFRPAGLTVTLNVIHLVASVIWVGGLSIIFFFWNKQKDTIKSFLPVFSKAALLSLFVLTATGLLSTWLFLPKLTYLRETVWGGLLIAKILIFLLVIPIAFIVRRKMHDGKWDEFFKWIKWDLASMLFIIGIVGVLTFQSPIPENSPVFWHEATDKVHLTTEITPAAPGTNEFDVKVFLNEKNISLKRIQFLLKNKDGKIAPIEVPLKNKPSAEGAYEFSAKGPYLPFAGDWIIELRILDSNDDETVYTKQFTTY